MFKLRKFELLKTGLLVLLLASLLVPSLVRAEDDSRTGYVHLERAMSGYGAFVDAMEDLQEFESEIELELRERRQQLEQAHQELQEEAQFLSPEEQQSRQQELMQRHQQFQMDVQQSQQRIEERESELLEPIHQRVQEKVAEVAEEKEFEKIVRYDMEDSDIVWVREELDITSILQEKLAREDDGEE